MVGVMGCQSDSREFNWRTFKFEQVGPRNHPRIVAEDEEFPEQIPESGMPKPNLTAKQQTAYEKSQILRLYICSEKPKSIAEDSYYLATQAPVDKLADLLENLFPAQGPGGSEKIRYLLYRNDVVWERAMKFASRLDVPPMDSSIYMSGQGAWESALGLLYGSEYPRKLDPETRKRVISNLNHVVSDESADRETRWAAAILAGNLHARFDPKDFVSADATFGEASELVPGDEFESLVVRYHHIHLLVAMNQPLKAKKQAIDAMNYFQKWENTECYERLGAIAGGK
jgi:hypothetical protein